MGQEYRRPRAADRSQVERLRSRAGESSVSLARHVHSRSAQAGAPSGVGNRSGLLSQRMRRDMAQTPARPLESTHDRRSDLPRLAEYVTEDHSAYILWDMDAGDEVEVAKVRAIPDAFPPERSRPAPGALLVRLSGFALVATLLGGAPGVALGLLFALVASIRLLAFRRRVWAWSRRAADSAESRRLPSAATAERLRLLTALGQSLLALLVGGALFLLLVTALR